MALVPDELYISSPSSHRVPCSPHVAPIRGSPACVPDIDQAFDNLGQSSPVYQRRTNTDSNSTPTFLRNPYLNLTETGYVNSFNTAQVITPLSQRSEQVVPSCSPFVSSQRSVPTDLSQRLSQESVAALSQPMIPQKQPENKNDVPTEVPLDEKAPTIAQQETRRQNRTLLVAQNNRERVKQLFDSDDIFDS